MIDENNPTYKEKPELFKSILNNFDFYPGEVMAPLNYFYQTDEEMPALIVKDTTNLNALCMKIQAHEYTRGQTRGRNMLKQEFRNLFNLL